MSTVTLHMVSSLDGFIAKKDNSIAWLENAGSVYEAGASVTAEEAAEFVQAIDCYVMGSRTYEHALELGWVYGDTPVIVVSSREWPPARKNVEFYAGDLKELVNENSRPVIETSGWWAEPCCASDSSNLAWWTKSG